MRQLTEESLAEALVICSTETCVNVGVVFKSESMKQVFAQDLEREVCDGRIPSALYLFNIYQLWFESASNISILSVNSNQLRGRRFDILLYDEQLSVDELKELSHYERPKAKKRDSLSKHFQWDFGVVSEEKIESPELDDFLGDFNINKT